MHMFDAAIWAKNKFEKQDLNELIVLEEKMKKEKLSVVDREEMVYNSHNVLI